MLIETEAKVYRIADLMRLTGLTKISLLKNFKNDTEIFKSHQRIGPCYLLTDDDVEELRRVRILVKEYDMNFKPALRLVRNGWIPPQDEIGSKDNER